MELNQIYCGDCLNLSKQIDHNSIDFILTSPPYDFLRSYKGFSFDFESIALELTRILKPGGVICWVVGDQVIKGSESGTSMRQALYFMDKCKLNLHDTMIYEKANFSNPSKNRYHQIFEYMFIFSKGKPKTFNPILDKKNKYGVCWGKNTTRQVDGEMVEVKKNKPRELGMRNNIWRMNTVGQESPCKSQKHPAAFPKMLARDQIISWTNENDIVFDPMCGSGTSCVEAKKLNRQFLGCDTAQEYVDLSNDKLNEVFINAKNN